LFTFSYFIFYYTDSFGLRNGKGNAYFCEVVENERCERHGFSVDVKVCLSDVYPECSIGGGKACETVMISTWRSSIGPLGAIGLRRNHGGESIDFIK
jgi:hypothetical protein